MFVFNRLALLPQLLLVAGVLAADLTGFRGALHGKRVGHAGRKASFSAVEHLHMLPALTLPLPASQNTLTPTLAPTHSQTHRYGNQGKWVDPFTASRGGGRSAFGELVWSRRGRNRLRSMHVLSDSLSEAACVFLTPWAESAKGRKRQPHSVARHTSLLQHLSQPTSPKPDTNTPWHLNTNAHNAPGRCA